MKVYFICYPLGPPEQSGYEHTIISLAEGLQKMGVEFCGNVNYWQKSLNEQDFLISKSTTHELNEFDVVVLSSRIFDYHRQDDLPRALFSRKRKYKIVFIDWSDGYKTPGFRSGLRNADLVLKTHYCSRFNYPQNFYPWQFGLSDRIIQYSSQKPFAERAHQILVNFRAGHQLRMMVDKEFEKKLYDFFKKNTETDSYKQDSISPLDNIFWKQSGRRHYPEYYQRLGRSKVCSAFGGTLRKKFFYDDSLGSRVVRKIEPFMNLWSYDRIWQYDSWRFWESLASSCCTLHLDFDIYGMRLPVMPVNGKHYVGFDLNDFNSSIQIMANEPLVEEIALSGREWVMKNYSPQPIAERFLNLVSKVPSK